MAKKETLTFERRYKTRKTYYIPVDLIEDVKEEALHYGASENEVVTAILDKHFKKEG